MTEGGSWEGTLTGVVVDGESSLMSGWYVGEGAHDGLMAYVTRQDDGESVSGTWTAEFPAAMAEAMELSAGEYGPGDVAGVRIAVEPMGEVVGPMPEFAEEPPAE